MIDLTSWKPESFGWYLDIGVRLPLDAATMYYARNPFILVVWALDPKIRAVFKNFVMVSVRYLKINENKGEQDHGSKDVSRGLGVD